MNNCMGNKYSKLRIPNSVKNVRENGLKKHTQARHTTFFDFRICVIWVNLPTDQGWKSGHWFMEEIFTSKTIKGKKKKSISNSLLPQGISKT